MLKHVKIVINYCFNGTEIPLSVSSAHVITTILSKYLPRIAIMESANLALSLLTYPVLSFIQMSSAYNIRFRKVRDDL